LQNKWSKISSAPSDGGDPLLIIGEKLYTLKRTPSAGSVLQSYDLTTSLWTKISTNLDVDTAFTYNSVFWTGKKILAFSSFFNQDPTQNNLATFSASGWAYDPANDKWNQISTTNQPELNAFKSVVWAGDRLLVYGGVTFSSPTPTSSPTYSSSLSSYDPVTNVWTTLPNAPLSWYGIGTATWTGKEMIVLTGSKNGMLTGAAYSPASNKWRLISTENALSARVYQSAVWTKGRLFVFGGNIPVGINPLADSAFYDPESDAWTTTPNGPLMGRLSPVTVWTGSRLIVCGGQFINESGQIKYLSDGAILDPVANAWEPMTAQGALSPGPAIGFWSGKELIIATGIAIPGKPMYDLNDFYLFF